MANPFALLQPALSVLVSEGQILPATGQAVVDLARPDVDEMYDQATSGEARIDGLWETPQSSLYTTLEPIRRDQKHLFRFFVDGSTRTYFIGTLLERERSSPVQIAQVGAACVFREADGQLRVVRPVRHEILFMLDKTLLSEALWKQLEASLEEVPNIVLQNTGAEDPYSDLASDPRSKGSHKSNWRMRRAESQIVLHDLAHRLDEDWLVLDGSLGNEYLGWEGAPVIGVVKSFRRDTTFQIGTGPRATTLNLYNLLADLGTNQRTAVFPRRETREGRQQGLMAFWYVRIRPQHGLEYPLMGVVKVEIPCPNGEPVDSGLVDLVSSCLLAERNVTVHGKDSRWHAHLYPIAKAEDVIKNSFYSEEVLTAAIKWPRR